LVETTGLKVTVLGAFPGAFPFNLEVGSRGEASVVADEDMMRKKGVIRMVEFVVDSSERFLFLFFED